TDVLYVLEGEATFVFGGQMVGGKTTRPDQWLGTDITGGETHHVGKGDVFVIPAGTPQWFKAVQKSISYFVVRVIKYPWTKTISAEHHPGMRSLCLVIALGLAFVSQQAPPARKTVVSIQGREFLVNGRPTYEGRSYEGMKVQGLLFNARMVQGIFDDRNSE